MKPKLNETGKELSGNQPWMPACWVAEGNKAIQADIFEDKSRRKSSVDATTKAILRAMRHDHQN